MYAYRWTKANGIFELFVSDNPKKQPSLRPVFKEELDYFQLNRFWKYPSTQKPLLWATGIRRYVLNGKVVAEAKEGNFYAKPTVEVYEKSLCLKAIDVAKLWRVNKPLMDGLIDTATRFIRETRERYVAQGYAPIAAFSGGKDSLALLDLLARELAPNEFYVVFSNTGMELKSTLAAVEKAKKYWPNLRFFEARCELSPEETWKEFGPPGRRMRWCCAVHKSTPTILKLRQITDDHNAKALIFDGVRADESAQRATYEAIGEGVKNISQVNCSPILNWGTAELYLYLLHRDILFNQAYRQGLFRVGCKVCPMSSGWWDGIANDLYRNELAPLLRKVEEYAALTKPAKERKPFIEQGGWKARMGGRGLPNGGNRFFETIVDNEITFHFQTKRQRWESVAPLLGPIVEYVETKDGARGSQAIDSKIVEFTVANNGKKVAYSPYDKLSRSAVSKLRGVANKVAYCCGCKTCEAQCPTGAFAIDADGEILIRSNLCCHCGNCVSFSNGKGCLNAKSLSTTGEGMNLKGLKTYEHFGLRKDFLEHYFDQKSECFDAGVLGNRQYVALRQWLQDAELFVINKKGDKSGVPSELFYKLEKLGTYHTLVWAIIWTNLVRRSTVCRWYALYVSAGETVEKDDLVLRLGDAYSKSTRGNAVTALCETLRLSPIGAALKQGLPLNLTKTTFKYVKQGWESADPIALLYSLYKLAEDTGTYSFSLSRMREQCRSVESKGVYPGDVFGIAEEALREMLQALAYEFEEYVRVSFVMNLDNVALSPEISSLQIVDLATSASKTF